MSAKRSSISVHHLSRMFILLFCCTSVILLYVIDINAIFPAIELKFSINDTSHDLRSELHEWIAMRTTPIAKRCRNPYRKSTETKYDVLNVSDLPLNMAPFLNRCQLNRTIFSGNHAEWQEMFANSDLGYIHNYKVAGTTIQESLHSLGKRSTAKGGFRGHFVMNQTDDILRWSLKFLNATDYENHRHAWYLMSDMFLFSLVRDPIDRFLSSYFEINTRDLHVFQILNITQLSGMEKLRALLDIFMLNRYTYLLDEKNTDVPMKMLYTGEAHLHPQTLFLLNQELQFFPFDYIGDLTHFDDIMRSILTEFIPYLQRQPKFYGAIFKNNYRNRKSIRAYGQNVREDFNINRESLSDEDIRKICSIYWMDYMCFPFEIPKQCNITQLFLLHYNKHVSYNDCHFS